MKSIHFNSENLHLEDAYLKLQDELIEKETDPFIPNHIKTENKRQASVKPQYIAEARIIDHSIY